VALVFVLINYLLTLLAAWLSRFLSFRTAGRTKPAEGPMAAEETTV
jgi:glutamate transport system permease protein